MKHTSTHFAPRIAEATSAVFGDSPLTVAVQQACQRYDKDVANIESGRGIGALLIAIVGAKGQGKTWAARQFVRDETIKTMLRSGDLVDDATLRLVWIGPIAPDELDLDSEIYVPCHAQQLAQIGQPYVILDTPGLTDADQRAAKLAKEALSLAPIKLLVIARDQIRAAANLTIARQIDGAICIPVISSVEPEEMLGAAADEQLSNDVRALREQLTLMAPRSQLTTEIRVPDFEISGNEPQSSQVFLSGILDRLNQIGLTRLALGNARDLRIQAVNERLRTDVANLIANELPQLSEAVEQLTHETAQLPQRVLDTLLGSEEVLETGVRMRLRARLVSDTALIWFPYRTLLATLNLTQGAWDRVMLALSGSVPSLFGALTSWARNVRQSRDFTTQVQDGVRQHTQQQVEERLRPLCDRFHQTVLKLRPRDERALSRPTSTKMRLLGIEELQTRSQSIFDQAIRRSLTSFWLTQVLALLGVVLFWSLMAAPIIVLYREYFTASWNVFSGREEQLENFPHPTASLFLTSLILALLPLAIYCMVVLSWVLGRRKVRRIVREIVAEHGSSMEELRAAKVIHLEFEDELLQQAEFLLNLKR